MVFTRRCIGRHDQSEERRDKRDWHARPVEKRFCFRGRSRGWVHVGFVGCGSEVIKVSFLLSEDSGLAGDC